GFLSIPADLVCESAGGNSLVSSTPEWWMAKRGRPTHPLPVFGSFSGAAGAQTQTETGQFGGRCLGTSHRTGHRCLLAGDARFFARTFFLPLSRSGHSTPDRRPLVARLLQMSAGGCS